jgi:hypothetical protein
MWMFENREVEDKNNEAIREEERNAYRQHLIPGSAQSKE